MPIDANYDESKVAEYHLPEIWPLGANVQRHNIKDWPSRRREIIRLFEESMYGRFPNLPVKVTSELIEEGHTCNAKGIRRQYRLTFSAAAKKSDIYLLLILPAKPSAPMPCVVALNFWGNHTTCNDAEILLTKNWVQNRKEFGYADNIANEKARGAMSRRWPFEMMVDAGFAVATVYYGDIHPDCPAGRRMGIAALFDREDDETSSGAIGYWAWGLSQTRQFLQTITEINPGAIFCAGHSRLGKTALWAAANDEHFAGAMANGSGCCGASLSRRNFGETPAILAKMQSFWFCGNFQKYACLPSSLPVDQHMLLAAIAPRPLQICSATEDLWADPTGERLSAIHASCVYAFLTGESEEILQPKDRLLSKNVGYNIRPGTHDILAEDWQPALTHFDRFLQSVSS